MTKISRNESRASHERPLAHAGADEHRATSAQKMVLLHLLEGWMLRRLDDRGWCLFRPDWERPLANISARNIEEMTEAGWLRRGESPRGLGCRPAKELSPLGVAFATELERQGWGRTAEWRRRNAQSMPNNATDVRLAA